MKRKILLRDIGYWSRNQVKQIFCSPIYKSPEHNANTHYVATFKLKEYGLLRCDLLKENFLNILRCMSLKSSSSKFLRMFVWFIHFNSYIYNQDDKRISR
jgi:hypothetical protein